MAGGLEDHFLPAGGAQRDSTQAGRAELVEQQLAAVRCSACGKGVPAADDLLAALPLGIGAVDVDDLVGVILAWGAC
ncbi:MAG: hypothetical protein ACYTGR_20575 [Planctomycetota bacterium]